MKEIDLDLRKGWFDTHARRALSFKFWSICYHFLTRTSLVEELFSMQRRGFQLTLENVLSSTLESVFHQTRHKIESFPSKTLPINSIISEHSVFVLAAAAASALKESSKRFASKGYSLPDEMAPHNRCRRALRSMSHSSSSPLRCSWSRKQRRPWFLSGGPPRLHWLCSCPQHRTQSVAKSCTLPAFHSRDPTDRRKHPPGESFAALATPP